jgi:DNA-binding CsgD family transcriptional regulator/DNA replicative helicase MCM subunit Mcm2 (Cdc46/Mcm family)
MTTIVRVTVCRTPEMAEIDRLLEAARCGHGGGLLLNGEPGIGKSTLLAYAREQAPDALVLSATGVPAESGLGYGLLQELLAPIMHLGRNLPEPQAEALGTALGQRDSGPPDRFLVSLAVLSLLCEAAAERTVLCLADDVHWADQPSLSALSFAARRLTAERVVLLASARAMVVAGFREMRLGGLATQDATELLDQRVPMAPGVRDALVRAAAGNPLALTELPNGLTAAQLAGKVPLPDPLPLPGELERVFADRIRGLPPRARTVALICAAAGSADLATILRAATALGAGEALGETLDSLDGILRPDGTFRHPLVRSAAYYSAGSDERRRVHRALAQVSDSDRRAWHLAEAATGPDPDAAAALEASAEQALRRGGAAAAADALERAAGLSVSPGDTLRRLVAAADAAWRAGDSTRTAALLDRGDRLSVRDADIRLRMSYLRGLIELRSGLPGDGLALLLPAGADAVAVDPRLAVEMLAAAGECAFQAGDSAGVREIAAVMEKLPDEQSGPHMLLARLYKAVIPRTAGQPSGPLDAALGELERIDDPDLLARGGGMVYGLGDYALARRLRLKAVARARALGAAGTLAWALRSLAMDEISRDRYMWAQAYASEGMSLAVETGQPNLACQHRAILAHTAAFRGAVDVARRLAEQVLTESAARGLLGTAALARLGLVNLELARGRPDEALTHLDTVLAVATLGGMALHATPDLVEAAVRAGRSSLAASRLPAYLAWAQTSDTASARALACRCRALLADPGEADELFGSALRWHRSAGDRLEAARTALLFGEHLRRDRRRVAAREQLRSAWDTFTSLGAAAWAERAAIELRATGETVRSGPADNPLTPQEFQIARLVSDGLTNRDVGAQLFISPRTVDHHLRNIYRKLGISSRTELARAVPAAE